MARGDNERRNTGLFKTVGKEEGLHARRKWVAMAVSAPEELNKIQPDALVRDNNPAILQIASKLAKSGGVEKK
ncbi:MAG: hypothetical protein K0R98_1662 [Rickettsiaceae bacterium]|jgi:hypothetical protein|nr:hypothetical protein [Rickettsiaceae bacterium]